MINITKTPNYETLKSAFFNGIEFKRVPLETYLEEHTEIKMTDNEALSNVFRGFLINRNHLQTTNHYIIFPAKDWDMITEKVADVSQMYATLDKGKHLLEATFNQGRKNPSICFMAWYDALAEYVISAANYLTGQKAPVPVINEELTNLSKSITKSSDFKEAKRYVYQELKKIYPKTYKKRLKLMERGYNEKVQDGIAEIVRKIVK